VLALTAESNRLFAFAGGPGRIGLHGRGGGGAARSAGCVRFTNDAIRWIVARVGRANLPGTAVSIR
jgi:lipoprotein-anchoring transpeptidase ErfK/SrfK